MTGEGLRPGPRGVKQHAALGVGRETLTSQRSLAGACLPS